MDNIDQSLMNDLEIISENEVYFDNELNNYKSDDTTSKIIEISLDLLIKFIKIRYNNSTN